MLESMEHNVVGEAVDGNEAILKYDKLKPDLVTMDIMLPFKNGIETTKDIRFMDPQAKILIISSLGEKSTVKAAVGLGAYDFILKPVDETRFISAIARAAGYSL